ELNKRGMLSPEVYNRFQQSIGGKAYSSQAASPEPIVEDVAAPGELAVSTNQVTSMGAPMQSASKSVTPVSIPSPQRSVSSNDFKRAFRTQQMGIMGQAEAEAEKSNQLADNLIQTQAALDKFEAARMEREQKRQQAVGDERGKLDSAINKMQEMRVDPGRYWANIGTEKKVLWALGAFFSGMSGKSGNTALEMLRNSIDADINAQKTDLDKTKFGI